MNVLFYLAFAFIVFKCPDTRLNCIKRLQADNNEKVDAIKRNVNEIQN